MRKQYNKVFEHLEWTGPLRLEGAECFEAFERGRRRSLEAAQSTDTEFQLRALDH